jgi:predicted ATPase
MSERPLITRVVLENYKSIAFCDVKLGPLSILVGPNGAGKSNFLDALRFLSDAMQGPVQNALEKRSGFSRVVRLGAKAEARISIRVEFVTAQSVEGFFSVRLVENRAEHVVEHERCRVGPHGYEAIRGVARAGSHPLPPLGPTHIELPFMAAYAYFSPALDLLKNCRFYNFSTEDFRQPVAESTERALRGDGSNLANVLNSIRLEHPKLFERIVQYLSVVTPAIKEIELPKLGGYTTIDFVHTTGSSFSSREISDGTLRSLALLVSLFQTRAGAKEVTLVGLEEPEAALHPAAAGVLFDALREASASVQLIATTHSADLLDKKDIATESILAVEMEDGITRIGHVDNTGREALRQRLYTAGELMRMNYLTPETSPVPNESEMESLLFDDLVSA